MKIISNIDRKLFLEAQSIAQLSRGGFVFNGIKRTIKKNVLRFFGSSDKRNYKPGVLIMN